MVVPLWALMPSRPHICASDSPSRPWTSSNVGESVTWKPVHTIRTSMGRSVPSAVMIECALTRWIGSVTNSTLSRAIAGKYVFEISMRLQPMVNFGVSFSRSSRSRTCTRSIPSANALIGAMRCSFLVRPGICISRKNQSCPRTTFRRPGTLRSAARSHPK